MKNQLRKYILKDTLIGNITIIFNSTKNNLIEEIIVSDQNDSEDIAFRKYGFLLEEEPKEFIKQLNNYLNGQNFNFSLNDLNMDKLTDFEKSVLIEEFNSEYGSTNTYSEIAKKIGNPKSSRAVGNALGKNPYPIVIPCHRTIKKNNTIGNYSGGVKIKRKLLQLEKKYK